MAMKLSETKPDAIYLSTCLATANPGCPYGTAEEFAKILAGKTGINVILGTHDYH
jgi:predicted metal-binding protein